MIIRRTQQSDLPKLSHIWYERIALLQQTDFYFTPLPNAMQVWQQHASIWLEDADACFYCAEHDTIPVGFICARVIQGPAGLRPEHLGSVVDIGIDLHQPHRHLGSLMVDAVKDWLNEKDIRILTVDLPARYPVEEAFWRSRGAKLRFNKFWMVI